MAEKSGLRIGDHVDPHSLTAIDRLSLSAGQWGLLRLGEAMHFVAERNGQRFPVELREPQSASHNAGLSIVKRVSATLFILVAALLLLTRPSTMLWGFFFYALGSSNGASLMLQDANPVAGAVTNTVIATIFTSVLGPLGLLMFATGSRRRRVAAFANGLKGC